MPHTEKIEKILKRSDTYENQQPTTKVEYWPMETLSDVEISEVDIVL